MKLFIFAAVLVATVSSPAALASPYSCLVSELGGQRNHQVQVQRQVDISTDLTDYLVHIEDSFGWVKVQIFKKAGGALVASSQAPSDARVVGQPPIRFQGVRAQVPGRVTVTCWTLSR